MPDSVGFRLLGLPLAAWRFTFWACMFAVMVLALMPPVPYMPTTGWDKSNHLLAFTVLALLGCWAYPGRTMAVLLGLLAYGGLIEALQWLTPNRFAEWQDLLVDGLGLLLGWGLATAGWQTRKRTTDSPKDRK